MQVDINVNFHQAEHLKIFSRKKFEEKKFVRFFLPSLTVNYNFTIKKIRHENCSAYNIALNYFLNPLFHVTAQRMKRCSDILVQAILHLKGVLKVFVRPCTLSCPLTCA